MKNARCTLKKGVSQITFTHPTQPVMARDEMMNTLAASLLRYVDRLLAVGVAVEEDTPPADNVTAAFISAMKYN